ncbi:MAG: SDR family NAD(P)-dependent oxidoreductase [Hyphomonadaceae bacterium]
MGCLDGKAAVVTGGARGLGRGYALALAGEGADVLINDTADSRDEAEAVAGDIRALGVKASVHTASVADWEAARGIIGAAARAFGRADIVVNNAGIAPSGGIEALTQDDWDRVIGVNLTGVAAISHWAARHWAEAGKASARALINVSSPVGAHPSAFSVAYSTSKAAVAALTIASAPSLAPFGVRVNAIAPIGRSRLTDATPTVAKIMAAPDGAGFDRFDPANAAPLVVYLASPHCRFTGRLLGVEGDGVFLLNGWTAEHAAENGGQSWTLDTITAALAAMPAQEESWALWPGGRMRKKTPSDITLDVLRTTLQ